MGKVQIKTVLENAAYDRGRTGEYRTIRRPCEDKYRYELRKSCFVYKEVSDPSSKSQGQEPPGLGAWLTSWFKWSPLGRGPLSV